MMHWTTKAFWAAFLMAVVWPHEMMSDTRSLNLELHLDDPRPDAAVLPPATLLASTLDGTLFALNKNDGEILWQMNDEPAVRAPYNSKKPSLPAFLPDPKDGSLYMLGGGLKDPLKKLPFTIPELVASSPCKSSDGILYTGRKTDTWIAVDRQTGHKKGTMSVNGCYAGESPFQDQGKCPNTNPADLLIGRTEYNIMMYDSRTQNGKSWNITFFDYSNLSGAEVGSDYDLVHFTDSSTGNLLTLDRMTGSIIWETPVKSPIVALYLSHNEGLVNVPFTSVSRETLANLLEEFHDPTSDDMLAVKKLSPTLYIGEHEHGLYAMPSLVDKQTLTISTNRRGPLLLEGPGNQVPDNQEQPDSEEQYNSSGGKFDIPGMDAESKQVILFGYYSMPDWSKIELTQMKSRLQITSTTSDGKTPRHKTPPVHPGDSYLPIGYPFVAPDEYYNNKQDTRFNQTLIRSGLKALKTFDIKFIFSTEFCRFCYELLPYSMESLDELENKELKAIVLLMMVLVATFIQFVRKSNQGQPVSWSANRMPSNSIGSSSSTSPYEVTARPGVLENGLVKVGNIQFDPNSVLGRGCEGTFVYKGKFDTRDVAVKRVLADNFSIADREVDLLRESDEHPNVIRYFCMEQDTQFRYIALEFCAATLQDYIDGAYENPTLDSWTILRQATLGLFHLHSLDICHRDIKPHNVLISMPGKKGEVRAMISDFGLCKKLKVGRMSFSRRSGIAGTEGWIAPEMMLGNRSTTCLVDMFSLGCVYYFVLSKGSHPFGESKSFKRQANILSGEYDLSKLGNEHLVAKTLIEKMLSSDPNSRPPAGAVLKHPTFWSKEKMLTFLQDVSDRVDIDEKDSAVVDAIERNRFNVIKGNWYEQLDPAIAEDLRQRRSYNAKSIRDLLRAIRNKKHHYQELSMEIKKLYGRLPDKFADYWFSKFPSLFIHSYHAIHCVKTEPTFIKYFHKDYDFLGMTAEKDDEKTFKLKVHQFPIQSEWHSGGQKRLFMLPTTNRGDSPSSQQSSVISQWEDRVFSDDDHGSIPRGSSEGNFHDMSKPLPDTTVADTIQKLVVTQPTKDLSAEATAMVKPASPRVRKSVAQLDKFEPVLPDAKAPEQLHLRPSFTWAEAVQQSRSNSQDMTTKDDAKEFSSEYSNHSGDLDAFEDEPEFVNCNRDKPCDKENKEPSDNDEDCDQKGPVWVLTEPEKPKKKNKKKKKAEKI